ncbi:MAG: hypothetical protein M3O78_07275 [Chloroflexota bacterium]|nr:hypothetical protein [Chloroflexota bacterium]
MSPVLRWSLRIAELSLALIVLGVSTLVVMAWIEVLNHPGYTLVDGYWVGRLPWTPIGIVMILVGSVGGLLAAALAIVVEGGWWRRALILPAWGAAALWWSVAMGLVPYPRFHGPDPVTFAFTEPTTAGLLLLLPAVILAGVAITPRRAPPPTLRLSRVHPLGEASGPPEEMDS